MSFIPPKVYKINYLCARFWKMWNKLAHIVLKYRLTVIIILGVITIFMAYKARNAEFSYDYAKIVPSNDPEMVFFDSFKDKFGEDGNVLALGVHDSSLYTVDNFRRYAYLTEELQQIPGVNGAVSIANLQKLVKNTNETKFELTPVINELPETKKELDSVLNIVLDQKFYTNQIINLKNGSTFILVSIDRDILNTKERDVTIDDIKFAGDEFSRVTGIDIKYVGLPYIRSEVNGKIKAELEMFLILSLFISALILLFFFRSWDAVVFPLIIVITVVIWSLGTLSVLNYKITMVTGLLPPIIAVIGIPNSIYLLNKYHQEINKHGNKIRALSFVIRKIGLVTLITNFTTAVGFLVLASTKISILKEFGIVAGINIMAAFVVSTTLIPAVFSYLPTPNGKQLKHLKFWLLEKTLTWLDLLVHRHRYTVFTVSIVVVVIGLFGILELTSVSYIVDDVPENSEVKQDLEFFENNFTGIMPLEIVIDTKKERGVMRLSTLEKVNELEEYLSKSRYISEPVSLVSMIKTARQAFYNNNPKYYDLPNRRDQRFIFRYLRGGTDSSSIVNTFVDSAQQSMRSSFKVADIGSNRLDSLIKNVVQTKIDSLFNDSNIEAKATGTTLLFVKGNSFLVKNLRTSLILAFCIIAVIMGFLFRNFKMILISLIPNLIPLVITAGLMGYLGIPLRPSTALIFCVAFGISVDDSIHFLAKYRQELFANNFFVPLAISKSIRETGASMMYTSLVLFAGFVIFSWSDFRGTMTLGVLTSTTLLIAMFTNLIVLPSLLMAFDSGKHDRHAHPPIENYDNFYQEDDDEEIDIQQLQLPNNNNGTHVETSNNVVN